MNNDLNDRYGNRAIWNIALPMIISTVSVPLLGIVDTAVLGHLDSPVYLAAVAVGATVFSLLFMGLNFLRMGTTGVSAQAFGAQDGNAILRSLQQPLVIAAVLAVLMLLLQTPIIALATLVLAPEPEVADYMQAYYGIRIWSAPAMLCNLVMVGWLLGMQNARAALIAFLTVNVTNMVLDVVFVMGFGLDVRGVAMATVIGEYSASLVCILLVKRTLVASGISWHLEEWRDQAGYLRLLGINSALFVRSLALMFTLAFITAQGARLGAEVLAVNAVLLNFLYFFAYATDGLASAAEALSGKATGERTRDGLQLAVRNSLRWTAGFAFVFALVYGLAGPLIIDGLTGLADVRASARQYLPWLIALPLVSAWCFLYDGVYVGMTRTREMAIVMVGSALLMYLPVWYVMRDTGNHALWAALISFMAVRSLAMHLWYRRIVLTH